MKEQEDLSLLIPHCWYCPNCLFEKYTCSNEPMTCPNDSTPLKQQTFKYRQEQNEALNILKRKQEATAAELRLCVKALSMPNMFRVCECDHGIDGALPLRGELCPIHKALAQPEAKKILNELRGIV